MGFESAALLADKGFSEVIISSRSAEKESEANRGRRSGSQGVIVRSGKGDTYREIPFNADTRNIVTAWLHQRDKLPDAGNRAELFRTRQGRPLSERAIEY